MNVHRLLRALLVGAALLTAHEARAEPSRVRILRARGSDALVLEATTRLYAELTAAGFAVDIEDTTATDPREELESEGSSFATVAILRVPGGAVADVWVADHLTGKTLVRRVGAGPEAGSSGVRVLAIRAVELLRASLLEIREPPAEDAEKPGAAPVPSDVAHWMEPRKTPRPRALHGWTLEIGGGTTITAGFGPTIAPAARILRSVADGYAVGIGWLGPTFGPELHAGPSSAQAHQMLLLAEVSSTYGRSWVAPVVTLGAGAADTYAFGDAAPPLLATAQHGFSFAAHVSAGVYLTFADHVGLLLDTGALGVAPTRPIQILGTSVGNQLPIVWMSSLGLVASF